MMMTAAGTPQQKASSWSWSCRITSYCNAKRMGAVVFATDVRMASKEQVESLGGKFLQLKDLKI